MSTKPYEAKFTVGARVRIQTRVALEQFKREWRYHNPLTDEQLAYADAIHRVREVGYYRGGEPLYALTDVPSLWHEQRLASEEDLDG
jgi:hypothetical protein